GDNLSDLITSGAPQLGAPGSVDRARVCFGLARELCSLFAQFHNRRDVKTDEGEEAQWYFVYQDLKPANIIRTPLADYFLIDFGTVRDVLVHNDGRHEFDYNPDHTVGYSAPEIHTEEPTEASDMYTFGTTLYHVVTGEEPQRGDLRPRVQEARQKLPPA